MSLLLGQNPKNPALPLGRFYSKQMQNYHDAGHIGFYQMAQQRLASDPSHMVGFYDGQVPAGGAFVSDHNAGWPPLGSSCTMYHASSSIQGSAIQTSQTGGASRLEASQWQRQSTIPLATQFTNAERIGNEQQPAHYYAQPSPYGQSAPPTLQEVSRVANSYAERTHTARSYVGGTTYSQNGPYTTHSLPAPIPVQETSIIVPPDGATHHYPHRPENHIGNDNSVYGTHLVHSSDSHCHDALYSSPIAKAPPNRRPAEYPSQAPVYGGVRAPEDCIPFYGDESVQSQGQRDIHDEETLRGAQPTEAHNYFDVGSRRILQANLQGADEPCCLLGFKDLGLDESMFPPQLDSLDDDAVVHPARDQTSSLYGPGPRTRSTEPNRQSNAIASRATPFIALSHNSPSSTHNASPAPNIFQTFDWDAFSTPCMTDASSPPSSFGSPSLCSPPTARYTSLSPAIPPVTVPNTTRQAAFNGLQAATSSNVSQTLGNGLSLQPRKPKGRRANPDTLVERDCPYTTCNERIKSGNVLDHFTGMHKWTKEDRYELTGNLDHRHQTVVPCHFKKCKGKAIVNFPSHFINCHLRSRPRPGESEVEE